MKCIRKIGLCLFLLSPLFGLSQEKNYELGNVLVRIYDDATIEDLMSELEASQPNWNFHVDKRVSKHLKIYQIGFDANIEHDDVIRLCSSQEGVRYAHNNFYVELRNTPNDAFYGSQWQYENTGQSGGTVDADLDADSAWTMTTGGLTVFGDTIVVCVIDDGIDTAHVDFGNNLWVNRDEIPGNLIDDDGNGYVDDYRGWNVYNVPADDDVSGSGWHGTPVAGIVGAKGNNSIGVSGVNWDVKLMIIVGGGSSNTLSYVLESYEYPLQQRMRYNRTNGDSGAFVVATNASWGEDFGDPASAPSWCDMYDTLGMHGILNCGSTINGNYDVDVVGDLPTACPSEYMIAVTNMDDTDNKVPGAGYGATTIDLGSYGAGTYTTALNNNYGGFGGTSGATPHVTGAIALAYSLACSRLMELSLDEPDSLARIMKDLLFASVQPNTSLAGITTTGGRLNLHYYMEAVESECNGNTGISENEEKIELFPNPASTSLRIIGIEEIVSLTIYDRVGKEIHVKWTNDGEVDVEWLPAGLYVVKISDASGKKHHLQFIKT